MFGGEQHGVHALKSHVLTTYPTDGRAAADVACGSYNDGDEHEYDDSPRMCSSLNIYVAGDKMHHDRLSNAAS